MSPIITRDRINALCNLARWRGWTQRPYSVGEHTAVVADALSMIMPENTALRRMWWLHDMHETEICGDVPTPDKRTYMNTVYDIAVEDFDIRIGLENGVTERLWWRNEDVKRLDRLVLGVENEMLSTRGDSEIAPPDYNNPLTKLVRCRIASEYYSRTDGIVDLYRKDAKELGMTTI